MKLPIRTAIFVSAAVLLSACTSFATTQKVRATIPFPFFVGNTTMPAGTYTIFPVTDTEVEVEGAHTTALISVIQTTPGNSTSLGGDLRFDKSGDHYFLRGVECDYAGINVEIPETKQERSVRTGQKKSGQRAQRVAIAIR